MEKLGDKNTARAMAIANEVPVVPGSDGLIDDDSTAIEVARKIGFPVLIKATAGGGGKGMRVAEDEASLLTAIGAGTHRSASRVRQRRGLSGTLCWPIRDTSKSR